MKLLVFAHTPPPHHGQSYMVQLMLAGFGGDQRKSGNGAAPSPYPIQCYHVNARLSKRLEDIGDLRVGKLFLLLVYCFKAIWCRFRYGVENLYYVPAPGKHSAIYRDWFVMLLCRPFFKRVVLHWHAAGLARWLETCVSMRTRSLTYRRMRDVDLSIVLSEFNRRDAEKLFPRRIEIISNGIPDPCPEFERDILPRRHARVAARAKLMSGAGLTAEERAQAGGDPQIVHILYLAHCTREKGLFDSIAGVSLANRQLAEQGSPLSLRLSVAGNFLSAADKTELEETLIKTDLAGIIHYCGFVSGERKSQLLREADLLCFPTYYENENQPVNLIESMAFGLPIVTTRWRSLPEMFPPGYCGLVDIRSPEQIARAVLLLLSESGESLRQIFVKNFTLERYLSGLTAALCHAVEPRAETAPAAAAR